MKCARRKDTRRPRRGRNSNDRLAVRSRGKRPRSLIRGADRRFSAPEGLPASWSCIVIALRSPYSRNWGALYASRPGPQAAPFLSTESFLDELTGLLIVAEPFKLALARSL